MQQCNMYETHILHEASYTRSTSFNNNQNNLTLNSKMRIEFNLRLRNFFQLQHKNDLRQSFFYGFCHKQTKVRRPPTFPVPLVHIGQLPLPYPALPGLPN